MRAVAISEILTHWNEKSNNGTGAVYSAGNKDDDAGWYAYALVDKTGAITGLSIEVQAKVTKEMSEVGIVKTDAQLKTVAMVDVTNREKVLELGGLNDKDNVYYAYRISIKSVDTPHA